MVSRRNSIFVFGLFLFSALIQFSGGNFVTFAQLDTRNNNTITNNNPPNIVAEDLYNARTMTLGNNLNNLVILFPNEGHHNEGEDYEARFWISTSSLRMP